MEVTTPLCDTDLAKYFGDGTTCKGACPVGIPAVSSWGIAVMALLVVAAGTLVLTKRLQQRWRRLKSAHLCATVPLPEKKAAKVA